MSKTIEGIPESFTRGQYLSFFEAVGVSPSRVQHMEFAHEGVYVTVFEMREDGSRVINREGTVTHRVFVPVVDAVDGTWPKPLREGYRLPSALRAEGGAA